VTDHVLATQLRLMLMRGTNGSDRQISDVFGFLKNGSDRQISDVFGFLMQ